MSDKTAIQWTEATWNPVTGCSKVSPGCAHCYAETLSLRYGWSKKPWTLENAAENVVLHPERLSVPLRWKRPRMIFVNSMSDLFHELLPDKYIADCFNIMALANHHTFQVLTKRPDRMHDWVKRWGHHDFGGYKKDWPGEVDAVPWPLPNVWLGVSTENQRWADARIPLLLDTPAAVRFISAEPLLGEINLHPYMHGLDWVIVGGESGPKHRPMKPDWAREIRDECQREGVPFFFKQVGGRTPKAGGRELDGREWNELPGQVSQSGSTVEPR